MRHSDGSPHVAGVPLRPRTHPGTPPGRARAVVLATYLVGDELNRHGMGVECDIVIYGDRRPIYGVPVEQRGGVRDCEVWTPSATTRNLTTGEELVFDRSEDASRWVSASQLVDLDGDHVSIEFFGANAQAPVIVGSLPHPRAARRARVVSSTIGATHPALPEGPCYYVERNGARLLLDWRGNIVLDTRAAGETNGGQAADGDEPAGTVYVQARAGQTVRVSVDGGASIVLEGDGIILNSGSLKAARETDPITIEFSPTKNQAWKVLFDALFAAAGAPPQTSMVGSISGGSNTVKAG